MRRFILLSAALWAATGCIMDASWVHQSHYPKKGGTVKYAKGTQVSEGGRISAMNLAQGMCGKDTVTVTHEQTIAYGMYGGAYHYLSFQCDAAAH